MNLADGDSIQRYLSSGLSISAQQEVSSHPIETGVILREDDEVTLAVFGAVGVEDPASREDVLKAVMSGLVMEGSVQQNQVRFPRLHRALGHMVIGNTRYR
jgi:hypothetical protein